MKAVILTRGRIATVDDADFDRVNQFKWHALKVGNHYYGQRNVKRGKMELLHVFIFGQKGVDHKNGDGLDNQRENLRSATKSQNGQAFQTKKSGASSSFRGVCWSSRAKKWVAQITANRTHFNLGYYPDEASAAHAYDVAALHHFGQFATLNFPCH